MRTVRVAERIIKTELLLGCSYYLQARLHSFTETLKQIYSYWVEEENSKMAYAYSLASLVR